MIEQTAYTRWTKYFDKSLAHLVESAQNHSEVRKDVILTITLFVVAFITRYALQSHILYHWDSINFAFGMQHFDVATGQPHIPGYILYVWLLRLLDLVFHNAQFSMVFISIFSSSLSVAGIYWLGKALFSRQVGGITAIFLCTSPLFWFYGEIALPHTLDTLMVIISVALFMKIENGNHRLVVPAAIWLALVGGFRPQSQVFLIPLAIYASRTVNRRQLVGALAAMALVDLMWFLPLILSSGGLKSYFVSFWDFYSTFNSDTSLLEGAGFEGLTRNVRKVVMYTLYGIGLPVVMGVLLVKRLFEDHLSFRFRSIDRRFVYLTIWILPSLTYYVFLHMGQQGLVFVYLPAILLLLAWGIVEAVRIPMSFRMIGVGIAVLGNISIFLGMKTFPFAGQDFKLLTWDTIKKHDAYYETRLGVIREDFDPEHSIVLSSQWRFPQYYLPEYPLIPFSLVPRGEVGEGTPIQIENEVVNLVESNLVPNDEGWVDLIVFDPDLQDFLPSDVEEYKNPTIKNYPLTVIKLTLSSKISIDPLGITISQ